MALCRCYGVGVGANADFYSTEPIVEYYQAAPTYVFTYPPGVTAGEAEWWTMPYYPEYYPYTHREGLP